MAQYMGVTVKQNRGRISAHCTWHTTFSMAPVVYFILLNNTADSTLYINEPQYSS